jgi:hypothetical protein
MDAGEVNWKDNILLTRQEYSVLRKNTKDDECGWSKSSCLAQYQGIPSAGCIVFVLQILLRTLKLTLPKPKSLFASKILFKYNFGHERVGSEPLRDSRATPRVSLKITS